MKYLQKQRSGRKGKSISSTAFSDDDPMSGVANLFDIGLVFIVGLLMTIFSTYHLQDLFDQTSEMTIMKKSKSGEMPER